MLLGPVFRAEWPRTARRRRRYLLRSVYGAALLLLVRGGYRGTFRGAPRGTIAAVARFAEETFITFADVQLATASGDPTEARKGHARRGLSAQSARGDPPTGHHTRGKPTGIPCPSAKLKAH
jgi:hypothetical protein